MLRCYHFKIVDYPLFYGRIQFYCDAIFISLCDHFIIDDWSLFCDRIQMCCDAITSQLLITHYFVVEFSSIVMLWLQNWWLPTILWDCDRTHMHCDAVTSKMMIDHYFVDRFFVLPLFRGLNSTNAVRRARCCLTLKNCWLFGHYKNNWNYFKEFFVQRCNFFIWHMISK